MAGGGDDDSGLAVATDGQCNVYICGEFRNSVLQLDDGIEANLDNSGGNDAYLARFSGFGDLDWRVGFGDSAPDGCTDIAVSDGRVFATGYVTGDVDVGGAFTLQGQTGSAYVAAFDAGTGEPIWGEVIADSGENEVRGLAVGEGRVVSVGIAYGPRGPAQNIEVSGGPQAFVATFDTGGELLWDRTFAAGQGSVLNDVVIDNNRVIVAGSVISGGDVTDGGCSADTLGTNGSDNAVIAALAIGDGTCEWLDALPSSGESHALAVAVDGDHNVLVAGDHRGNTDNWSGMLCDFNGCPSSDGIQFGGRAALLARWSPSGVPDRAFQLGGESNDHMIDLVVDPGSGDVYALARFLCNGNFGGETLLATGPATCTEGGSDEFDVAVARYSSDLEHIASFSFGSPGSDGADAIDLAGDKLVIRGELNQPFSVGGFDLVPTGNGSDDMFTAVIDPP